MLPAWREARRGSSGQILLEALLGVGMAAILGGIIVIGIGDALVTDRIGTERSRAFTLAAEGLEAARAIRDRRWDHLIVGDHGIALVTDPVTAATTYAFTGHSDVTGIFTRIVAVEPVTRTAAGDVTADQTAGSLDQDSKVVRSTVRWDQGGIRPGKVELQTMLTNWRDRTWVETLESEFREGTLAGTQAVSAPPPPTGNGSVRLQMFGSGEEFGGEPRIEGQYDFNASGPTDGRDVAVSGGYAFVVTGSNAGGASLYILDVSLPASPTLAGSFDPVGRLNAIAVRGAYAYVATDRNHGELRVVDVRDVTNPVGGREVDVPGSQDGRSIAVDGRYLYLGTDRSSSSENPAEFHVFVLDDPAAPVLLASLDVGGESSDVLGIATKGPFVYLATASDDQEIQVVDVSVPSRPRIERSVNLPRADDATSVVVSGNTAYVARGGSGELVVLDVTDPANPEVTGTVATGGPVLDVSVLGSYAYLATGRPTAEFLRIDISNPAQPKFSGTVNLDGEARAVFALGPFAYLATNGDKQEFAVVGNDPSSPVSLAARSTLDLPASADARAVAMIGTLALIGTEANPEGPEFWAVDVRNPDAPRKVGSLEIGGAVRGITADGSYAYLATSLDSSELVSLDISDPRAPRLIGAVDAPGTADGRGVALFGTRIVLARDAEPGQPWLSLIEALSPLAPGPARGLLASASETFLGGRGVSLGSARAYVPVRNANDPDGELQRIDVTDVTAPQATGAYDAAGPGEGRAVHAAGKHFSLLTDERAGAAPEFFMVTASGFSDPLTLESETSALDLGGGGNALQVFGPVAYVATDAPTKEFQVLDLQNRASPARRQSWSLGSPAYGVAVADDYIYLATGKDDAELVILEGKDSGFATEGTAESVAFDSGFDTTVFLRLAWHVIENGGVVKFQVRTGMTQTALEAASYIGPDGTGNTHYASSPSLLLDSTAQPLAARWVQWKAYLSGDGSESPELQEVLVSFRQ